VSMVKMVGPTNRRDLMSRDDYVRYYTQQQAPVARAIPGLVKYFANPALRGANGGDPAFDSVAEMYWESPEAIRQAFTTGEWQAARTDHLHGIAGRVMVVAEETDFEDRLPPGYLQDGGPPKIKYLAFLNRKDGMSRDDFKAYWFEQHVPKALRIPNLLRYRASICLAGLNGDSMLSDPHDTPAFDGVVEIWFDTVEAFDESFNDPSWNELRRDYYLNFAMGRLQLLVEENLVMDDTV
jgi:uncharacterized protein (TIGR02118 family)